MLLKPDNPLKVFCFLLKISPLLTSFIFSTLLSLCTAFWISSGLSFFLNDVIGIFIYLNLFVYLNLFIYLYLFIYLFYLFLAVLGPRCCTGFLLLRRAGATLHCGAQASHCSGFSCGTQALGTQASVAVARGL